MRNVRISLSFHRRCRSVDVGTEDSVDGDASLFSGRRPATGLVLSLLLVVLSVGLLGLLLHKKERR